MCCIGDGGIICARVWGRLFIEIVEVVDIFNVMTVYFLVIVKKKSFRPKLYSYTINTHTQTTS